MNDEPEGLPPGGLSSRSRRRWLRYSQNYDFCLHDLDLFEQALRAQDLVDEISGIVASEGLVVGGKPHPMLGALRDARQTALRYWRACGFKGEDEPTRRPGRPSGDAWSASRKAAALRLQRQQGGGGA